jgi:hypothetical protein
VRTRRRGTPGSSTLVFCRGPLDGNKWDPICQTSLLTPQEEIEFAARIKKGDQKARAWMIKANLRLVVKIAHHVKVV